MLAVCADGKRIGLLGGSFNPAHRGHRRISLAAIDALGLDEVWWLVSPGNPLKAEAAGHGAVRGPPCLGPAMARRAPIRRQRPRARRRARATRSTRCALLKRAIPHDRFIWLMGSDTLPEFHKWRDYRALAPILPIAVVSRPGYDRRGPSGARDGLAAAVSSDPEARRGNGRSGVHRRSFSFACPPTRPPPPACARSTPTGIVTSASPGVRARCAASPSEETI